ncbi:MAG: GHKL domain-containing protein [Thiothrix sp.]|nr:GHKL domain-containing protein [Thiothrix sp.]HPE60529.1 ATP-binding protein [Thiolinea sp.]
MIGSLRSRQLVSGFTIIVVGILILGVLLSISIYTSKKENIKDEMERLALNLMGYILYEDGVFRTTKSEAETDSPDDKLSDIQSRLSVCGRGCFAYIWDVKAQKIVWNSVDGDLLPRGKLDNYFALFDFASLVEPQTTFKPPLARVIKSVPTESVPVREDYMVAIQQFSFRSGNNGDSNPFLFIVASTMKDVDKEIDSLIRVFTILFFVSVILILIAQLASSFWVVAPIREFEEEVNQIEKGNKEFIEDEYPEEMLPIKNTINALIGHEKGQKQRYKDSLDDLAHSLKTPLAAIQHQLEGENFSDIPQDHPGLAGIQNEIEHMQEIISRQLRKAMVTTDNAIIMSQPIRPILVRLANTMKKVHHDKQFEVHVKVDEFAKCRLDTEDMMELFGNLLNNACRFCDQLVEVSARREQDMLVVDIDDDGMGFPSDNPAKLLKRGIREDSKTEGQGIGLAVSTEIVSAVNGRIELLMSPYVGARVRLYLPT